MKFSKNSMITYSALLAAVLFWGLSFIATKIALQSFSPFILIFFRFFVASLFFGLLLLKQGIAKMNRKEVITLIILALFQPVLYFTCETFGLQHTSATKTSLIIATIPIIVLVLSAIFLGEKIRLINFAGIILSLAGVGLLIFGDNSPLELRGNLIGDLFIFGAVLAASGYMVITRQLGTTLPSYQITAFQIIFGAIMFLPFFLWDLPHFSLSAVTTESLIALIALTLFATIGGFLCYNFALTQISAAKASVFINGIPVVTALGAWVLLDESLTPLQILGGIIVMVAVYLANMNKKKMKISRREGNRPQKLAHSSTL